MDDNSKKDGRANSDDQDGGQRKSGGCPMHGNSGGMEFSRRSFVVGGGVAAATLAGCGTDPAATPTDGGTNPDGGDAPAPRDVITDAGDIPQSGSVYRIHPAIGVVRLGNAPADTFFIGPEIPGRQCLGEAPGTAAPPYKADGLVKPQGARFRLYEYRRVNGKLTPYREVNLDTPGVVRIDWTAHLANKKASFHQFNGLQGEHNAPRPLRNATVTDRASLEIDFGPRTISGRSHAPMEFRVGASPDPSTEHYPRRSDGSPVIDYLGQVRTDDKGRLIVIGGLGKAAFQPDTAPPMASYVNNNGWFDDASDGPVTASVVVEDSTGQHTYTIDDRGGSWCICPPPTFAPGILSPSTLYDLQYDMAIRSLTLPEDNGLYSDGGPLERLRRLKADFHADGEDEFPNTNADWDTEIHPWMLIGFRFKWVTSPAVGHHMTMLAPVLTENTPAGETARQAIFHYMRPPTGATISSGQRNMPLLLGSDPYTTSQPDNVRMQTMTRTQIGLMRRWAAGHFNPPAATPPPLETTITPHGLDRAAAENCCGGAFYPGIEIGWQCRNPAIYIEPFRLNIHGMSGYFGETDQPMLPGHFTRQMALPWHADFNDCQREGQNGWWPAQRPDDVFINADDTRPVRWARPTVRFPDGTNCTHQDMVDYWYKFGFAVQNGDAWLEVERAEMIP